MECSVNFHTIPSGKNYFVKVAIDNSFSGGAACYA